MTKLNTFSYLALTALGALLFSSCTNSTSPNTPVIGAPSNLMALSKNASTISIRWTRGANDTAADKIVLTNSTTGTTDTVPTTTTATSQDLTVTEGDLYSITVASSGGQTSTLKWMSAQRNMGLRIYETNDNRAGDYSALILASNSTRTVSEASASNADFVLESITDGSVASGISFVNGYEIDASWNDDKISTAANYIPGGLDSAYRSTDYSSEMASANGTDYPIPADNGYNTKGSRVLIVNTQDGHLALIEIVPDPSTGLLYSTDSGHKYITVNVSYQSVASQPYASRPHPHGFVPHVSAQ